MINSVTGYQNIALGYIAGQDLTDGVGNIYIANPGVPTESNTIRIGNVVGFTDIFGFGHPAHTAAYMAGISGQTASDGVAVYINSDGKLGTLTSSARFKTEIKPMDKSSEAILALKPVPSVISMRSIQRTSRNLVSWPRKWKRSIPILVVRDPDGKAYTVRYEAVNAMLLNEFLKEHRKNEQQEATIAS